MPVAHLAVLLLLGVAVAGCAEDEQSRPCDAVDPVRIELGGIDYAIPASYQPTFFHEHLAEKDFYLFGQLYKKDGKVLKYRYCKRAGGTRSVRGLLFQLEHGVGRRADGYDVRDAIVSANAPRFNALEQVTLISIQNVPASIEPKPTNPLLKNAVPSHDGSYLYSQRQGDPDDVCSQRIFFTRPTLFGGRVKATCIKSWVKPHTLSWDLTIAADALGKPHGRLSITIVDTPFAQWDDAFVGVKHFIDSLRD